MGPKTITVLGGFPSHHFTYPTQAIFLLLLKKILYFIKRYCNDLDIKPVFSSFKIGNMFGVKDPIRPAGSVHVWFPSFHVQAVIPVTSAKRSGIFHACERAFRQS